MDGGDRRENNGKTIMKHVMLRFRPIAPKPVTDGSGYSDLMRKELLTKKRIKRKYVRVNKNNNNTNNKNNVVKSNKMFDESMVTLELLPEIGKKGWWSSDLRGGVESWVSLECVTGGGGDGSELGCTDGEKVSCLEMDTCPGFVSERDGGVRWVNMAYRRMVGVSDPAAAEAVVVWLVEKEKIPVGVEAFSCRVRVAYGGKWKVVPCDVWRMDGELGAFAWRLDIQAALSLGP